MYKIFIISLFLVSCSKAPDGWGYGPRPWLMRINPDQRYGKDNDWTKGFNDGCITGMDGSSGIYRFTRAQVDGWKMTGRNPKNPKEPHPDIKSSKLYLDAWFDGYEHCTYQYDWWVL